jgi:cation transporter-like permease
MTPFSASDAALEGFQVIRRQWRLIVGWAGFNLVGLLAAVAIFVIAGVFYAATVGGDASQFGERVGGPLVTVATLVIQLMIVMAVYRLMFRPDDRGFLYLRFGPDELRGLGVSVLLLLGVAAIAVLAALVARAVQPVAGFATVIVAVLAVALAYWLIVRFGFVLPLCVEDRRIDFAKSWRLSRGRTWALVGMTLLAGCLGLLMSVIVWGAFFALTLSVVGFGELGNLTGPEGFRDHPGLFLLQAIAPFVFGPFAIVVACAPWAAAYQALSAPEAIPDAA